MELGNAEPPRRQMGITHKRRRPSGLRRFRCGQPTATWPIFAGAAQKLTWINHAPDQARTPV